MHSLYELGENEFLIRFSRGFQVNQFSFNTTVRNRFCEISTVRKHRIPPNMIPRRVREQQKGISDLKNLYFELNFLMPYKISFIQFKSISCYSYSTYLQHNWNIFVHLLDIDPLSRQLYLTFYLIWTTKYHSKYPRKCKILLFATSEGTQRSDEAFPNVRAWKSVDPRTLCTEGTSYDGF